MAKCFLSKKNTRKGMNKLLSGEFEFCLLPGCYRRPGCNTFFVAQFLCIVHRLLHAELDFPFSFRFLNFPSYLIPSCFRLPSFHSPLFCCFFVWPCLFNIFWTSQISFAIFSCLWRSTVFNVLFSFLNRVESVPRSLPSMVWVSFEYNSS